MTTTENETVDETIKKLRAKLQNALGVRMSQPRFGSIVAAVGNHLYGVDAGCSVRTVQDWEYGTSQPNAIHTACILKIIDACDNGRLAKLPEGIYYDKDFYIHFSKIVQEIVGKVLEKS